MSYEMRRLLSVRIARLLPVSPRRSPRRNRRHRRAGNVTNAAPGVTNDEPGAIAEAATASTRISV